MVEVPQDPHTGPGACLPHPDGMVTAAGQELAIRTPRHPFHNPTMAAQHPGWRLASHVPDGHQGTLLRVPQFDRAILTDLRERSLENR